MAFAPSTTKVCNLALDEIPAKVITSISETSVEANACRRNFDQCLSEMMENPLWTLERQRVTLAELAVNDRGDEWGYAYAMPAGVGWPIKVLTDSQIADPGTWLLAGQMVAPQWVWPGERITHEFAGSTIYTGIPEAVLEYVPIDPAISSLGPLFVKALSLHLAAKISMPIKGDRNLKDRLLQDAEVATSRAMAAAVNRNPSRYGDDYVPDVIRARMS
jgi:hypothetical protein